MSGPKYLMWFSRFGNPHLVKQYHLEDCYELDDMLDDAETEVFDQYGVLNCVEHIGNGVIPDDEYEAGLDRWRAEIDAEVQEIYERAVKRVAFICRIEVRPPGELHTSGWEVYSHYLSQAGAERDLLMLRDALGDDRVRFINL